MKVFNHRVFCYRFCESPVIVPICTKVDTKDDILSPKVTEEILSSCKKIIKDVLDRETEKKRKVILFHDVIHFSSKANLEDSDTNDQRKNQKYLRALVAALCGFYFQEEFQIPNSWNRIGIN